MRSVLPAPDAYWDPAAGCPTREQNQGRIDLCARVVWRKDHDIFQLGQKSVMAALVRLLKYREAMAFSHDPHIWPSECFVYVKDEQDDIEVDQDATSLLWMPPMRIMTMPM